MSRGIPLAALFAGFLLVVASVFVARGSMPAASPPASAGTTITDVTYWPDMVNRADKNRTQIGKENATIYMLVRNFELHEALESIRKVEDRFNRRFRYPWVFLNDDYFTEEFMALTTGMVSGEVSYGHIDPDVWDVPAHINKTHMDECIEEMIRNDVIYGGSRSYRNMCRFNSGNFFWHPLMQQYDWYWRVEPGIDLFCDQLYDPFQFLRENGKVYGFVITIQDVRETIPTLFRTVLDFIKKFPQYVAPNNALDFATDIEPMRPYLPRDDSLEEEMDGYNLCHFWSNFEIGSLNFFRSDAYTAYFKHLDASGGFHYERWGDAPVHTLGLLTLANKTQIHHFSDIGYYHIPFHRCPHDTASFESGRCLCPENGQDNVDFQDFSCLPRWWKHMDRHLLYNYAPNYHDEQYGSI